jgi:predicted TIM-barrel fold metal-dependent hydrolase
MTMTRREFSFAGLATTALATAAKYHIVDAQIHVWIISPQYPWAQGTTKPPSENRTPDMALKLMKANGVQRTVIAQYIGYKWDNHYCLDSIRKFAPYFRGVCRVDPNDPSAPDHLSDLTEQGFHGVRISPTADAGGDWINGPLMPPLWARAQALRIPMQIYTPITRMPDLAHLLEQFPGLTVVIDHMGDCPADRPEELEKLIALARYPRVFVKISHTWSISHQSYPWLDAQEHVKRLHAAFGPQRLMWASDWPVSLGSTTYDKTLSVVRDEMSFLNAEDKSWILGKTAQQVWPFA